MPDADRPRDHTDAPADWSAAFAALPQAEPLPGGWDRIAAHLPARPGSTQPGSASRAKWPVWLATAASLALAAAVPLALMDAVPDTAPSPSPTLPATQSVARVSTPPSAAAVEEAEAAPAIAAVERDIAGSEPQPQARVASVEPTPAPSLADRTPVSSLVKDQVDPDTVADTRPQLRLAEIQQESARLEALLAMAHDDRVGSGTGAMLAAQLQSRLSQIDSVLASDAIDDDERLALWDARVDTLRDLTGLETTERWFAAEGRAYDTALVQVH
ncbi:hypothetical protein [Novilysobacter selenitireducens]|uniref:Uncharacterized protein n=1 Tax=Novilysobacter selenitireducens TaxID=2872639 RepID=A0ABS7T651_9GAMM|nr:hypothetical protein [Lysobacter selenitireducens]MBZ4039352.1 hypothetical protein [Lysobacter selenitireducens]